MKWKAYWQDGSTYIVRAEEARNTRYQSWMKEAVKKEGIWHPNLEVNLFLALFGSLYIQYSEDRIIYRKRTKGRFQKLSVYFL